MGIVYKYDKGNEAEYERIVSLIDFVAQEGDKVAQRVLAVLVSKCYGGKDAVAICNYLKAEFYSTTFESALNEEFRAKKISALKHIIDFLSFYIDREERKKEGAQV